LLLRDPSALAQLYDELEHVLVVTNDLCVLVSSDQVARVFDVYLVALLVDVEDLQAQGRVPLQVIRQILEPGLQLLDQLWQSFGRIVDSFGLVVVGHFDPLLLAIDDGSGRRRHI